MAEIDSRIALGAQGPQFQDPMALQEKAMSMRQMAFKQQQDLKDADYQNQMRKIDMVGRLAGSAVDQPSYEAALAQASNAGMDVSKLPRTYDQNLMKSYQAMALTAKEKLSLENDRLNRQEARDERRYLHRLSAQERADARADKQYERDQALTTPFGLARTTDDAKQIKEGYESKQTFDNKIDQMIALRKKHNGGAIWNREDVARGKQLSKDLLLEYKNMAKLGVLSKSDEDIINAIIPEDPLQYSSPVAAIQGQDPTLNRLVQFKNDSDKDFATRVQTRMRDGGQKMMANQGTVNIIAPDGRVKAVPRNQVDAALSAGGKLVDQVAGGR